MTKLLLPVGILLLGLAAVACDSGSGGNGGVDTTFDNDIPIDNDVLRTDGVADVHVPSDLAVTDEGAPEVAPETPCIPACEGLDCGDDGCGGTCGSCPPGQACTAAGSCEAHECGETPLVVDGAFITDVGQIAFDHATATLSHKQDIDPSEDGCIVSVTIELGYAAGCVLEVSAYGSIQAGALEIQDLGFYADSQCPGFSDDKEGSYYIQGALDIGRVSPGTLTVPDQNAATSCFSTTLTLQLAGTLTASEIADPLVISQSEILVTGEVLSTGSTSSKCPCAASCAGKQCGDDGCGGSCGQCPAGDVCENGHCSCVPACVGKEC
jgi:hypothetical protein